MTINIGIIGYGTVGSGFSEILLQNTEWLRDVHDLEYRVIAVADRGLGTVFNPGGLDLEELARQKEQEGTFCTHLSDRDVLDIIPDPRVDVWCELSTTNLKDAYPAIHYIRHALRHSKHVITTNKGPAFLHYRELKALARQYGVEFLIEGTVMAGTPVINLLNGPLAGCRISKVTGILNGTTNFILSKMEEGLEYGEALQEAQQLGYAEADPSGDIEGLDALAKVKILSNIILNRELDPASVSREGISGISRSDIILARQENKRWKLIGCVEVNNGSTRAYVRPEKLDLSHPLASIGGNSNALTFTTDLLGDVTIIGPGAGKKETGFAVLSGLMEINRTCQYGRVLTT